jgi:hypothetical protein
MGWMADKQQEADARLASAVATAVPAGETVQGVALANRQSTFSAKPYALAVTEHHLILQPLDRKLAPTAAAVVVRPDELEVGNVFQEGAGLGGLGQKGQEIRFTARGEQYRLMALGGNMVENSLASDGQLAGLGAVADFLRRAGR